TRDDEVVFSVAADGGRLSQYREQGSPGERNLELIAAVGTGNCQLCVDRGLESRFTNGFTFQRGFDLLSSPRFMRNATECQPNFRYPTGFHTEHAGYGNQGKGVAAAVAHLAINLSAFRRRGQLDMRYPFARLQNGFDIRAIARG